MTFSSCLPTVEKYLKSDDVEEKYRAAENYYIKKKYNNAQQLFENLFPLIKGTDKYEDVFYKYAYTAYYQHEYLNAENLFKTFAETFPNSDKAEECEYMRAYCYYKEVPFVDLDQTPTEKAIAIMQSFIANHPGSKRINDATEVIDKCRATLEKKDFASAKLYYNLGYFKAAALYFANMLVAYPESSRSEEYKSLEIKSYLHYALNSIEDKQAERFKKVIEECDEFNFQFSNTSPFAIEIIKIKKMSTQKINKLQNEQSKKSDRS